MASFRKRGDKWEYRIRYSEYGKQKEVSKSGFSTKAAAKKAAVLIEEKLLKGGIREVNKGDVLFEDWLITFKQIHERQRRASSNISARNGQLKLIERFTGYKLKDIKRSEYQIYINELLFDHDYAKATVDRIHGEMMAIINAAVTHDELERNVLRGIQIKKEEPEEKVLFLDRASVHALLKSIETTNWPNKAMVHILLFTGMRSGELLGLEWADIDFDNRVLHITKQRNQHGIGPPKTKAGLRDIILPATLVTTLLDFKKWQESLSHNWLTPTDYVMVDHTGKPFYHTKPQDLMKNILRDAGLQPRKSAHILRHTHAVMLLESGADIKTVSTRLGHSTIEMTANIYLHVTKEHEAKTLLNLENYLKF